MFLVTTANQKFWEPESKKLFLGEWCNPHQGNKNSEREEHKVLPFLWEDRQKVIQSLGYINKLFEKYLKTLSAQLNEIHQVDYSPRYWRIIVGPWLYFFLMGLYDRFLNIHSAINSNKVTNTWIPQNTATPYIPKDYNTFIGWSINDDYNLYLYSLIIIQSGKIPYEEKNEALDLPQEKYNPNVQGVKPLLKTAFHPLFKIVPERYKKIVFVSSYFKLKDLLRLQLYLKQFPALYSSPGPVQKANPDLSLRARLTLPEEENPFETLAKDLVTKQIPTAYLESYQIIHKKALDYFPQNPELILTANDLFGGESFKFWSAHHVSRGCKLAGIQHGGGYGSRKIDSTLLNESRVSDYYYTWGWNLNCNAKTRSLPAGKLLGLKKINPKPAGDILVIGTNSPRYSFRWGDGDIIGPEMVEYFENQGSFYHSLNSKSQAMILFRLYPADYNWDSKSRLNQLAPGMRIYQGNLTMMDQLKQSRLCVCTNNSTTFLETLSINYPTLVFWNTTRYALRKNARPYFDSLRNSGILHDSPESAGNKVNEIFDNPLLWWNSLKVQNSIKYFCSQFAQTNGLNHWKKELKNILDNNQENK